MKMTSAYASKLLRQLEEERSYLCVQEMNAQTYTAAEGEKPLIPAYNYTEVSAKLEAINRKVCLIKHAVNLANVTHSVEVAGSSITVDAVLVRMAQLSRRKNQLDLMRKVEPVKRLNTQVLHNRVAAPEFQYVNYDLEQVKADYDRLSEEIMQLQMALDLYNQTVQFEVELEDA